MLSIADAALRIQALIARVPTEVVALAEADGRILATPIVAGRPLPGFDNSAMDGFAVRAADVPGTLPVVAAIAAGARAPAPLPPGAAVRIMTGAPLPPGADAIVMFEDARDHGATVELPAAPAGDHVRRQGEDVAVGDLVVAAGTLLGSGEVTVAAALGCATVTVARRPRVAILATGDELRAIDAALAPGELVDSSSYGLRAAVRAAGGAPDYLGVVGDDRDATTAAIARALAADVVITTGGVSVGDHDHVRAALTDAGVTLDFWKVAMRPGKPLAVGQAGATMVFALPGNPVSSWVGFELFVRPALLAMQGAQVTTRPRAPVVLPDGYRKPAGRAHVIRVALVRDGARLIARPHPKQGSAMQSSLVGCDALVEIAAELTEVAPGDTAPAWLVRPV
ncbi:MAG: molybdopterin molybdotransferase MoeA [Myxococcales bacterium]|nr:molybdopterin molybdotransferase MoeA [Myxococcales bacterium]